MFIVTDLVSLNVRDGTESKYPSIVFLGILQVTVNKVKVLSYFRLICANFRLAEKS